MGKISIGDDEYLNPLDKYTPPEWALSKDGINFSSFGDVHFLTGQSGTGKTFTFVCLMAAITKGEFGPIKYVGENRKEPRVLYIDTEQSKGNTQLVMRRIYHMAGWGQGVDHRDRLEVLMLRETTSPEQRWGKCIKAMYDKKPDFVFIDGALDIVADMNKSNLCSELISECLACSSLFKCCMFLVVHENPLSLESALKGLGKMAGHIGSFLQRKAAAGIGTVKKLEGTDATMTVIQKKARNKDFGDWSYKIHDEVMRIDGEDFDIAVPYAIANTISTETTSTPESKDKVEMERLRGLVECIGIRSLSYHKFREELKTNHGIGSDKATKIMAEAERYGIIEQRAGKYSVVPEEKPKDNGMMVETNIPDDPFE